MVKSGNCWGILYFSPNFTLSTIDKYALEVITNDIISESQVQLTLDNSNEQISLTIEQATGLFRFPRFL
jgi:hypothetical protein